MSLVDVARQVVGALRVQNGGSGNKYGWSTGVIQPMVNRNASSMPLGSVVYCIVAGGVDLSPSAAYASVMGVVVGYFSGGDQNNLVVGAVASGAVAAVMTDGVCRVLTSADVTLGQYATTGSTAGKAVGTSTAAAGVFGQFIQNGVVATRPLVWVRLFGTAAGGATLSPLTTKGDLYGRSSSADVRIPVGTNGQMLMADSTATPGVSWATRYGQMESDILSPVSGWESAPCRIPYDCTIEGWTILSPTAQTAVFDVKVGTYAGYPSRSSIVASDPPTLTAASKAIGSSLTGWTTSLSRNDELSVVITSITGPPDNISLILNVRRTT